MTRYEWDIETLDEYGDIENHDHRDKLSEFPLNHFDGDKARFDLVLVRDVGSEHEGVTDRLWAYVFFCKSTDVFRLPEFFSDCGEDTRTRVPKRFQKELDSHSKRVLE